MHSKELCYANASYVVQGGSEDAREAIEIRDNKKETVVTFVFGEDVPIDSVLIMTIEYSVSSFGLFRSIEMPLRMYCSNVRLLSNLITVIGVPKQSNGRILS